MLTLMVLVLLAYSFLYNRRDRLNMTVTDYILYIAVALLSLGMAAARDLDVHLPMPTVLLKSGMEHVGEWLIQKE